MAKGLGQEQFETPDSAWQLTAAAWPHAVVEPLWLDPFLARLY